MIRVLIVADIRLYRDGLAEILGRQARLQVVGTAASGPAALACAQGLAPDVVLIDQAMPDNQGVVRLLLALLPLMKIVALGVPETEQGVISCAEAGVSGYVSREASVEDLAAAIESVGRGELLCSPRAAASLLRRIASHALNGGPVPAGRLTVREAQIVRLIEDGLSNKEIALRLGIEVATVKNHVHNLLEKLRVHRRAEAAAHLRRHALAPTTLKI